jgi:hypothetical protein
MTPRKQKNIDAIAHHIYFDIGHSPESFTSKSVRVAIERLGITGYEKAEFLNAHEDIAIDCIAFDYIADAMWKLDAKAEA